MYLAMLWHYQEQYGSRKDEQDMAYVAVKGGQQAIEESIRRLKYERVKGGKLADVKTIQQSMRQLIDQVMSEASLYSTELASIAIKQGEGSMEEAVFLLRAYRSTLPRKYYSMTVESEDMEIERRISAAFKDIPDGQILGTTYDYTHRLLDFDLRKEKEKDIKKFCKEFMKTKPGILPKDMKMTKVSEHLRQEGLLPKQKKDDTPPKDTTKQMLSFPTVRSERLQILTRGMTQAVTALGYASLRGYGVVHPTVSELRVGMLPIYIQDPYGSEKGEDSYYIGSFKASEVESLIPVTRTNQEGQHELEFQIGYGMCYGQNETKAIAMSILDQCLESEDKRFAVNDEEFVLYHIDSVEATGFISHLKLPHYVTFQSKLNSMRKTKKERSDEKEI